jgi:hypothetical protein
MFDTVFSSFFFFFCGSTRAPGLSAIKVNPSSYKYNPHNRPGELQIEPPEKARRVSNSTPENARGRFHYVPSIKIIN